jgi:hypothetical protein
MNPFEVATSCSGMPWIKFINFESLLSGFQQGVKVDTAKRNGG